MEIKKLTTEQITQLHQPLPAKALRPHPTKAFLTTINSIYVTERLNEVFGVGSWQTKSEIINNTEKMVVVKTTLTIPEYGIYYECFGGNDNADKGDAHKGAVTDAITKIGSWLGIGAEVWKNEAGKQQASPTPQQKPKAQPKPAPAPTNSPAIEEDMELVIAIDELNRAKTIDELLAVWTKWKAVYGLNNRFIDAKNKRKNELNGQLI
jgi:hypothetical protein